MKELENKTVEFKCRMCGYYYEAMTKLCVLERQKISDEFETLIFERRCPNCGYLNREIDRDLKRKRYIYSRIKDSSDVCSDPDHVRCPRCGHIGVRWDDAKEWYCLGCGRGLPDE